MNLKLSFLLLGVAFALPNEQPSHELLRGGEQIVGKRNLQAAPQGYVKRSFNEASALNPAALERRSATQGGVDDLKKRCIGIGAGVGVSVGATAGIGLGGGCGCGRCRPGGGCGCGRCRPRCRRIRPCGVGIGVGVGVGGGCGCGRCI